MLDRLPLDIIDLLLQHLPSLKSLCSAVTVSRHVYQVYQSRPQSITMAVAYNEVGPALLEATRLYYIQSVPSAEDEDGVEKLIDIFRDNLVLTPMNWAHAKALSVNAEKIHRLEIYFSRRSAAKPMMLLQRIINVDVQHFFLTDAKTLSVKTVSSLR